MATRASSRRSGETTLNRAMITLLSVARLKEECEKRGLPTEGNKQALSTRLEDSLNDIYVPPTRNLIDSSSFTSRNANSNTTPKSGPASATKAASVKRTPQMNTSTTSAGEEESPEQPVVSPPKKKHRRNSTKKEEKSSVFTGLSVFTAQSWPEVKKEELSDMEEQSSKRVAPNEISPVGDSAVDNSIDDYKLDTENANETSDTEVGHDNVDSMMDDFIEEEGIVEVNERIDHEADTQKDTVESKKKRRSSRTVSRPLKCKESEENSDEDEEDKSKKSRTRSEKVGDDNMEPMMDDFIEDEGNDEVESRIDQDTVESEKKRRYSRTVFKPLKYKESKGESDEDSELSESSECSEAEKTRRLSRNISRNKSRSEKDSDEDEGSSMKKSKSEKNREKATLQTPQCVLCEHYSLSVFGYNDHLMKAHKSTLRSNGIYLHCSCGEKFYSNKHTHRQKCAGRQFTIHKLEKTPQCIKCEAYPRTAQAYARHLYYKHNNYTMSANGIYLKCSCGEEFRSHMNRPGHIKKCDGRQFTLHKLCEKIEAKTTPQCILCEAYPTTAFGYAQHLYKHQSNLKANGIYLECSCGKQVHYYQSDPDHNKKCDGRQFTLHKLDKE